MISLPSFRSVALVAACTFAASQGRAATVVSVNFDTASGNYQYGYAFSGYGDPSFNNVDTSSSIVQTTGIVAGIGPDGSAALRIVVDASATGAQLPANRTYDYLGFALAENAPLSGLPSGNLSNYTFALSSMVSGLVAGAQSPTGRLDLHFYAPDGTIAALDGNRDELLFLRYATGIPFTTSFQTTALNLGAAAVQGGSVANFTAFYSAANEFEMVIETNDANAKFGYDAGNTLVVDNISLDVVPEPTTTLSLALGALVLARRRRQGCSRTV